MQDSKARKELLHAVFRACDLNGDDWLSEGEFRNIAACMQRGEKSCLQVNCLTGNNATLEVLQYAGWGGASRCTNLLIVLATAALGCVNGCYSGELLRIQGRQREVGGGVQEALRGAAQRKLKALHEVGLRLVQGVTQTW